jgi:predicted RND superfamily exporter protein
LKLTEFILKYRVWIIVILLCITCLFGTQIKKMGKDVSINSMMPEDNPDFMYAEKMKELFGATDQFVVGIRFKGTVYTTRNLTSLKELSDFFENMPEIKSDDVKSIFAVKDVEGRENELVVDKLLPEGTRLDDKAVKSIRERVRSNPMFRGKMVSTDERSAVILAGVDSKLAEGLEAAKILAKIRTKVALLKKQNSDAEFYIAGVPVVVVNKAQSMDKDMSTLFPLVLVVVMVVLFLLLKTWSGLFLPMLVTIFSIVWTYGLKGMLGSKLTMAETIIPVMLIAIGCADGVHIINEFNKHLKRVNNSKLALVEVMKELWLPVILTSVTTALGFASLITSPGQSLKNMGIFMAFGVMVAMVFSLFFIPAILTFKKDHKRSGSKETKEKENVKSYLFLQGMAEFVIKYRYLFLVITVVILVLSIFGIVFAKVEASDLHYLKKDHPLYVATTSIEKYLGGAVTLDIIVKGGRQNFITEPGVLRAIWDLQKFCEKQKLVSYTLSVVDQVKRINYVMHANDPGFDRIPNDVENVDGEKVSGAQQVAQFLLLYEMGGGKDLEKYVDSDLQSARISIRLKDMRTHALEELIKVLKPYIKNQFPNDVQVRFANYYKNYISMSLVVSNQIISLLATLFSIGILMSLIYRSVSNGMLVVIPTFITVLFNFVIMWIFNISLNPATAIIASVGMGVGIDYGIHYFARFSERLKETGDYQKALIAGVVDSGKSIFFNAIAVGGGFLVLLLSDYHVIASMGWIVAIAMMTTTLTSLTILPALIAIFKPKVNAGWKFMSHNNMISNN